VVVIVNLVISILEETPDGVYLSVDDIKILTLYVEQKEELEKYVKILMASRGYKRFPMVVTIDGMQGGQSKIIVLDLTAANPTHGSKIGFMQEWNRLNVALTRAQRYVFMVGNLDAWRPELKVLGEGFHAEKMAYMIVDLLDLGDIIDVPDVPYALPSESEPLELLLGRESWSRKVPELAEDHFRLPDGLEKMARAYRDPAKHLEYELKLLIELKKKRQAANDCQVRFDKGEEFETELFEAEEGGEKEDGEGRQPPPQEDANNGEARQVEKAQNEGASTSTSEQAAAMDDADFSLGDSGKTDSAPSTSAQKDETPAASLGEQLGALNDSGASKPERYVPPHLRRG
jgi:hypothetical protein